MSDTSLKSPKEATCNNNTHIYDVFWGPAWGAWGGPSGKRNKNRATGPKHITKRGPFWPELMSKKWYVWIKMLRVDIENCASCIGGSTFSKTIMTKTVGKWKMELGGLRWQVKWVYEGAWWGWKAKMLKKCLFLSTCLMFTGGLTIFCLLYTSPSPRD